MNKEIIPYVTAYVVGTILGSAIVLGIVKTVQKNNPTPRTSEQKYETMWDALQANIN